MINGIVIEYDDYIGKIKDQQGVIYIFTNNDLKSKNIKINDYVSFEPELYKTIEISEYRARFVKKLN